MAASLFCEKEQTIRERFCFWKMCIRDRYTFRAVLKDANFGEMFVGSYKPESIDNLFLSIQTFNSQSFTEKTSPDFYDYIIVDEFHLSLIHF